METNFTLESCSCNKGNKAPDEEKKNLFFDSINPTLTPTSPPGISTIRPIIYCRIKINFTLYYIV